MAHGVCGREMLAVSIETCILVVPLILWEVHGRCAEVRSCLGVLCTAGQEGYVQARLAHRAVVADA